MEVLELLHAKLGIARRILRELVANYDNLSDNARQSASIEVLDDVNSYLQVKENLIFPYMAKNGEATDLMARSRAVDEQLEDITEHAIHMHVDETDYYERLVTLLDLMDLAERTDQETIFPWARQYLNERDQLFIATHLKGQIVESIVEPERQLHD